MPCPYRLSHPGRQLRSGLHSKLHTTTAYDAECSGNSIHPFCRVQFIFKAKHASSHPTWNFRFCGGTWVRERHCDDTPLAGERQIQMERSLTPVDERVGVGEDRKQEKCTAIIPSHNVLKYYNTEIEHACGIVRDELNGLCNVQRSLRRRAQLAGNSRRELAEGRGQKAWADITARLEKPTYYGRNDRDFKIKCRKQKTDVAVVSVKRAHLNAIDLARDRTRNLGHRRSALYQLANQVDIKKGYIIDPTIRIETGSSQPEDVNKEKINIYLPTVDYFKAKYQLEVIEVIGLLIGARGVIPKFFESFRKTFELPQRLTTDIITSVLKRSCQILSHHIHSVYFFVIVYILFYHCKHCKVLAHLQQTSPTLDGPIPFVVHRRETTKNCVLEEEEEEEEEEANISKI
ncbi:hypothetical protein ANN_13889 [Periplaneta americana]|uniref:Uncharacterized protein n=1 Tax=Periplaneta americana TaxID=6978 RepID=A0ABQ8SUS9_PERAM|nr:hypothetical protein ANN_13889 [Periplaneta americana]